MWKYIIISVIFLLSCHRGSNNHISANVPQDSDKQFSIEEVQKSYNEIFTHDVSEKDGLLQFKPTHMVVSFAAAYRDHNNTSGITMLLSEAQVVGLINTYETFCENGIGTYWARVITSREQIGWCLLENLIELDQSITDFAMNNINNPIISMFNNEDEGVKLILDSTHGSFVFEYGMNRIGISYFKKDFDFDSIDPDFEFNNRYRRENFRRMEISIANQLNIFPDYLFNTNRRRNIKNDVIFVDSFIFSVFENSSRLLRREIFLTTNNYDIRISISPNLGFRDTEIMGTVVREAPNYFRIRGSEGLLEFNDKNLGKGEIIWANSPEQFGIDLLNNANPSETAATWFNETEKILNNLFIIENENLL